MDEEAPDELQRFIILDRYRYLTKVRAYITRGEWALALSLLSRLNTYYELCERPYGQAEVALMTALVRQRSHQGDWQEPFRIALDLCEKVRADPADRGRGHCGMRHGDGGHHPRKALSAARWRRSSVRRGGIRGICSPCPAARSCSPTRSTPSISC
jgi:hypothetical protein